MYVGRHVECLLFLSDFNETFIFSTHFKKYTDVNFFLNLSEGVELFHADRRMEKTDRQTDRQTDRETDRQRDRQTDRQTERHDECNSRFSNCAKAPRSQCYENNMRNGITHVATCRG